MLQLIVKSKGYWDVNESIFYRSMDFFTKFSQILIKIFLEKTLRSWSLSSRASSSNLKSQYEEKSEKSSLDSSRQDSCYEKNLPPIPSELLNCWIKLNYRRKFRSTAWFINFKIAKMNKSLQIIISTRSLWRLQLLFFTSMFKIREKDCL